MNWTRTILDGLAMAAYFNLFAATVALYQPRLMLPLSRSQGLERAICGPTLSMLSAR